MIGFAVNRINRAYQSIERNKILPANSVGKSHCDAVESIKTKLSDAVSARLDFRRSLVSFLPEKSLRGRSAGSFPEQRLLIEPRCLLDAGEGKSGGIERSVNDNCRLSVLLSAQDQIRKIQTFPFKTLSRSLSVKDFKMGLLVRNLKLV